MKPGAHDWTNLDFEDESMERALFAARARVDREAPPPVEAVFAAAIEAPRRPRVGRAAFALVAAAACITGMFALANAAPDRERIVSDRGDASTPAAPMTMDPRELYSSAAGATTCEMDRTLAPDPSDFGACTAEAMCSIAGP